MAVIPYYTELVEKGRSFFISLSYQLTILWFFFYKVYKVVLCTVIVLFMVIDFQPICLEGGLCVCICMCPCDLW